MKQSEDLARMIGAQRRYKWGFWPDMPEDPDTLEFSQYFSGALAEFLLKMGHKLEIKYVGVGYGQHCWVVGSQLSPVSYGKYMGTALYNFMRCQTNVEQLRFYA